MQAQRINPDKSIGFCASDAYLSYDTKIGRDFKKQFNTVIRKVTIGKDSVIFNGNFYNINDSNKIAILEQPKEFIPEIPYKYNSTTIHYAGLFFEDPQETEYQYQLKGFDKNWNTWTKETKAVYQFKRRQLYF